MLNHNNLIIRHLFGEFFCSYSFSAIHLPEKQIAPYCCCQAKQYKAIWFYLTLKTIKLDPIQNYISKPSHAKAAKRSMPSLKPRLTPVKDPIKEFATRRLKVSQEGRLLKVNTLLSLRKWAEDSITCAEKGRFLADTEKREVYQSLTAQIAHLDRLLDIVKSGEDLYSIKVESAHNSINKWLESQVSLNDKMSWFELAPYPIPDHIQPQPSIWHGRQYIRAFHNKMAPMIKQDDELSCVILDRADYYQKGGVVCVLFREGKRKRGVRKYSFGRVESFCPTHITLVYDNPYFKDDCYTIFLSKVLFVLRIESANSPSTQVK